MTVRLNYFWNVFSGNRATYLVSLLCDKAIMALGSHCFSTIAIRLKGLPVFSALPAPHSLILILHSALCVQSHQIHIQL